MAIFSQERKVLRQKPSETSDPIRRRRKLKTYYALSATLAALLVLYYYRLTENVGYYSTNLTLWKEATTIDTIQQNEPLLHFIHTTNQASFHRRSLRAVESVFYHHPNATVLIHVPDDAETIGLHSDMTEKPFLRLINAGYNVTIQRFKIKPLIEAAISQKGSSDTTVTVRRRSAEKWMKTEILKNALGKNWHVDVSDLVRLLVLYTQGGMYMDTDVIVVNPLDTLPDSIVGFERPGGPNNAVLKFSTPGNAFLADCINEYFARFRSSTFSWGFVGPRLLKRVFVRKYSTCQAPDYVPGRQVKADDPKCPVLIIWKDAFYPDIEGGVTVRPDTTARQELIRQKSFVVHTYNTRMKQELATVNITSMMKEETLCNWLYNSYCIFCEDNVWV